MYGLRPLDGMGCAHIWIPDQARDDSGEDVLSITTIIQAERDFYYRGTTPGTVIPGLIRDPYMDEVHIIIPAKAVTQAFFKQFPTKGTPHDHYLSCRKRIPPHDP